MIDETTYSAAIPREYQVERLFTRATLHEINWPMKTGLYSGPPVRSLTAQEIREELENLTPCSACGSREIEVFGIPEHCLHVRCGACALER